MYLDMTAREVAEEFHNKVGLLKILENQAKTLGGLKDAIRIQWAAAETDQRKLDAGSVLTFRVEVGDGSIGCEYEAGCQYLGLTDGELAYRLRSGTPFEQVLKEQGRSLHGLLKSMRFDVTDDVEDQLNLSGLIAVVVNQTESEKQLEAVAYLQIDMGQLGKRLLAGETLGEIAKSKGRDYEGLLRSMRLNPNDPGQDKQNLEALVEMARFMAEIQGIGDQS